MEEEFEKWAEKKARQWVDSLIMLQRKNGVFMSICNLECLIIKAFKEGRAYDKDTLKSKNEKT